MRGSGRRRFLIAAAISLASSPAAFAQQRIVRIGFLCAGSRSGFYERGLAALQAGLRDSGYVEGKNLVIEYRWAEGKYDRLPDLARQLVQLKVDVIVAVPSPAIRAAKEATTSIPIVFPTTGDPVGSGFAASLAHPGGNITGISNINLDVSAKLLELLSGVVPRLARVAMLGNPGSSTQPAILRAVQAAAQKAHIQVLPIEVRTAEEIDSSFPTMSRERAQALIIATDALMVLQARRIAEHALKHRLPSITQLPFYAEVGGLMSYGQNTLDGYRRAASYVDRILKGSKPGELPIEQPTKLELVINRKTAATLGVVIPQELLLRADRIIE